MPDFELLPATNALGQLPRLDYGAVLPVLGVDTEFLTNSRDVLEVVEEAFGAWRRVDRRMVKSGFRLTVNVVVTDGGESTDDHVPVQHFWLDAERLIAHSSGNVGITNPPLRESTAYVRRALIANRDQFRVAMLEALTFALLAQFDRHPLHAAAVARDNRAVLLVGESGAGKSTLAYLAARAGLSVLAEDHVWIQLEPALRVWGGAGRIRLDAESAQYFSELAPFSDTTTIGGKTKLSVEVSSPSLVADEAMVCLLSRGASARLERVDAAEITAALSRNLAPGFDRSPERHERVVRTLAARGGWRLELSPSPHDALPLLEQMLQHGNGS
jgi:hypothetical protein